MIKRPLLFAASAFIIGIMTRQRELDIKLLLLVLCVFFIIIISLYRLNYISLKYDIFLLFLPILFVLGYKQMNDSINACHVEYSYDKKDNAVIEGIVTKIQKSKNKDKIYINYVKVISDTELICCGEIILYTGNYQDAQIGNTIRAYGKMSSFKLAVNKGQFDEYNYYKSLNICAKMNVENIVVLNADKAAFKIYLENIKYKFTKTFFELFPEREAGIITAMLLGEKAYMDEDIIELYQKNGIAHILAVSGLHMSLIGIGIFKLLLKLKRSLMISIASSSFIICCYAYMTGFSVSAKRAMIMLLIFLAAKLIGCTYDIISSVSLSSIIILFYQPLMLYQASFLLSFGAIFAIAFIYPLLDRLLDKKRLKGLYPLINSFMLSLSIQIITTPIILYFYYVLPLYSIFLNLLVIPLMTFVAGGAVAAGIAGIISMPIGRILSGGPYFILKFYELLCSFIMQLPYHLMVFGKPDKELIVLYYILTALIIIVIFVFKKKALLILFAILIFILKNSRPEGIEAVFLDVGQGDSVFVRTHYGTSFLFDGGSSDVANVGKYRLKPFLLSCGIEKLDYVFISHIDIDHINGIIELMKYKMVKTLVLQEIANKDDKYYELECIAKDMGVSLQYFCKGSKLSEYEFMIECLHPEKGMTFFDNNSSSMILEITYKDFSMLLTGDADITAEMDAIKNLINNGENSNFTVLKVSHHGSNYSSSDEFIKIINPLYSVISSGKYNTYGHPGKYTIERLLAAGSNIYVTADNGAVIMKTDGYNMIISTMIAPLVNHTTLLPTE